MTSADPAERRASGGDAHLGRLGASSIVLAHLELDDFAFAQRPPRFHVAGVHEDVGTIIVPHEKPETLRDR